MSSALEDVLETRWFAGLVRELHVSGLPLNSHSNVAEAARLIKPQPGLLFGFSVITSNATAQFIQVHDSQAAPASGAVPVACFQINGGAISTGDHLAISYIFPGRFFQHGIWLANSSTMATLTAGSADCLFDAQFA
jgi:hypothetical protein